MSTALTLAPESAFMDLSEILNQNQQNLSNNFYRSRLNSTMSCGVSDRRAVGTPITNSFRNRNFSGSSFSSQEKMSPTSTSSSLISFPESPISLKDNRNRIERSMSDSGDRNCSSQKVNSSRYKTELCRPFEENGHCKYGDKCQFAHGGNELRSLSRHPKYKTELCRTFHTIGFCPYGPRCHFIHNEDERKLSQVQIIKRNEMRQQQEQMRAANRLPSQSSYIQRSKPPTVLNLPPGLTRESLGSTADSPPSSLADSPTMSPTFGDDFFNTMNSVFSTPPPMSAPPMFNTAFPFQDSLTSPLSVQCSDAFLASLAAGIVSMKESSRYNMDAPLRDFETCAPPSPPDSFSGSDSGSNHSGSCGSPLDVSKNLRLPIFSRLSQD